MEQHPIEKLQQEIAHYMSRNDELQSLYQDEHCEVLRLQKTLDKIRDYCVETSEDNDAMVGEHLVSDDILDIINKAKGVNNAR